MTTSRHPRCPRANEAVGRDLLRACLRLTVFACLLFSARPATIGRAQEAAAGPKDRAESFRALTEHLGIGEGATIADIGAGRGGDSWLFATVVGRTGTVYAQEIGQGQIKSLKEEAEKRELPQVETILGRSDDPCLPERSVDMAYMRQVYHHFSKPREMLRGIWRGLRPGGYLVIVDRQLGTLKDWVPVEVRQNKHHWTAETTVVREAREEGFEFAGYAEQFWHERGAFVLVFRRPKGIEEPGRDPDAFEPLAADAANPLLPLGRPYERPLFVALGEVRAWIGPILEASSGPGIDVVLEEWATQKDERPPLPEGVSLPSVFTTDGDPGLGPEPIDVVFFLDAYHRLFHGPALLAKIHERLAPGGCVYVLDRSAEDGLSRRGASHHRRIDPEVVRDEMEAAGFAFWFEGPPPAPDRFLLVFGKSPVEKLAPEADPLVGGPSIAAPPEQWLKTNAWRLRGVQTADGKRVRLDIEEKASVERVEEGGPGLETWRIAGTGVRLAFKQDGAAWVLVDARREEDRTEGP
jgi:predicted methyltransferase